MTRIFDPFGPPTARNTDPDTSHDAAEVAGTRASKGRILVLKELSGRPLTDLELSDLTGWQHNSIGKRRTECRDAGLVEACRTPEGVKMKRPTPAGAMATVWRITEAGRAFLKNPDTTVFSKGHRKPQEKGQELFVLISGVEYKDRQEIVGSAWTKAAAMEKAMAWMEENWEAEGIEHEGHATWHSPIKHDTTYLKLTSILVPPFIQ
jgi:hypothetical protein